MKRRARLRDVVIAAIAGFVGGALIAIVAGPIAGVLSGAACALGAVIAVLALTPHFGAIDWGFACGFAVVFAGGMVLYSVGQSRWPAIAPWLIPAWCWTAGLPLIAILRWRARTRTRRGLCPKCAYPVGSSPTCAECGAAVAKHKAETQKAETA